MKLISLSEKTVQALPVPEKGTELHWASGVVLQGRKAPNGFGICVTAAGTKTFILSYRVNGKKHRETLGTWDGSEKGGALSVLRGVIVGKERAEEIARGVTRSGALAERQPERTRRLADGIKGEGLTVDAMLDQYFDRREKDGNLRSLDLIRGALDRHVRPAIGTIAMQELKRRHIIELLDGIADKTGSTMADRVLAYLRTAINWYAKRDDEFRSPIVAGMARTKPSELAKTRSLDDVEIRDLWAALETEEIPSCYRRFIKALLLTGQRRSEVADLHVREIGSDGLWEIPAERFKGKRPHAVPLTDAVRKLIGEAEGFVFSTDDGETSFSGFSKCKIRIDRAVARLRKKQRLGPMPAWTLHDLRRTARSLMARAGVSDDVAERTIGHAVGTLNKTYNRHAYAAEKLDALQRLGALVERILNPADNVVALNKCG